MEIASAAVLLYVQRACLARYYRLKCVQQKIAMQPDMITEVHDPVRWTRSRHLLVQKTIPSHKQALEPVAAEHKHALPN